MLPVIGRLHGGPRVVGVSQGCLLVVLRALGVVVVEDARGGQERDSRDHSHHASGLVDHDDRFAWLSFALLDPLLGSAGMAVLIVLGLLVGHWAIDRTGRDIGAHDHGAIVWDEVVAFWLVLWVIPSTFSWQLMGFLLFRLFDIVKPRPIRSIDRTWQNAFGVLADDLMAAAYTLLLMAVWSRLFG